jgi:hypothetical protein
MKGTLVLILIAVMLSGCGLALDQVKKGDKVLAEYAGQKEMTADCRAGIAQADADISPDPVNMSHIKAVTKFSEETDVYKECYNAVAWLYYKSTKYEGAVRTWLKKLTELGVIVP